MNLAPATSEHSRHHRKYSICLIAGEASGDAQGALLVQSLREIFKQKSPHTSLSCWGIGGALMHEHGFESFFSIEELAVMGFYEVLFKYKEISRCYKKILNEIQIRKPDAVIFIDYPGFNLRLMKDVFNLGITTIYHIPPKAWSHGEKRTKALRDYSYLVTSILPFEKQFFESRNVPLTFVGNPLKDNIDLYIKKHPSSKDEYKIGILPGSRRMEIEKLLPVLLESFVELEKIDNRYVAHIPVSLSLSREFVINTLQQIKFNLKLSDAWFEEKIKVGFGNAYEVLQTAQYAWVCSGTASLEAAFFQTPMSVMYKVPFLSALIARMILKIKYVSLVNLCKDKEIVPEFLQDQATAKNLIDHALFVLKNKDAREKMISELKEIGQLFPAGAADNAALKIYQTIMDFDLPTAHKFHIHSKMLSER